MKNILFFTCIIATLQLSAQSILPPVQDWHGKSELLIVKTSNPRITAAVQSLEEQMKVLESTFQFAYYPGDHFTVWTPEYEKEGMQFLKQKYVEWIATSGTEKK